MMPCSSSRSFPCNFCDQKFRSAQALGGHMNLHRRDRARLRNPTTALFSGSDVVLRCLFPADLKAEALESLFLQLGVSRASLKKQQSNSVKATDLYSFNMKEERVKFHSFLPEFDSGLKPEAGRKLESSKFNSDAVVGELDLELRL